MRRSRNASPRRAPRARLRGPRAQRAARGGRQRLRARPGERDVRRPFVLGTHLRPSREALGTCAASARRASPGARAASSPGRRAGRVLRRARDVPRHRACSSRSRAGHRHPHELPPRTGWGRGIVSGGLRGARTRTEPGPRWLLTKARNVVCGSPKSAPANPLKPIDCGVDGGSLFLDSISQDSRAHCRPQGRGVELWRSNSVVCVSCSLNPHPDWPVPATLGNGINRYMNGVSSGQTLRKVRVPTSNTSTPY